MQTIAPIKTVTAINTTAKFWFVIAGSLLFNLLFWNEKIAFNTCLFFLFVVGGIIHFYPTALHNKKSAPLFFASLFSLSMVVWHNTILSKLAFMASLILMAAFSQYTHNSLLYAGASALQSFLFFIPSFLNSLKVFFNSKRKIKGINKKITLAFIPVLILTAFFLMYLAANKVFASFAETVVSKFELFFSYLLNLIKPERLLFLGLGLWVSGGLLVRYLKAPLEKEEVKKTDELIRKKGTVLGLVELFLGKFAKSPIALKNEYISGIICLLLLNILLLLVNTTDIIYVWFSFKYTPGLDLTQFVHDGADLLVISIMSAMMVVLFFFRGNLNFFSKNKYLKILAFIWIAQNAILAVSVCIRNIYYIQVWGLAYKRVGLFVYILLVIIGLISIVIKIKQKKSSYYLWRVNAMAGFIVLILSSSIDWGYFIADYNIKRKDTIHCDIGFILQMNDNILPLLEENKQWICASNNQPVIDRDAISSAETPNYCKLFSARKSTFFENQKAYSWLSWNYADAHVKQQLSPAK